MPLRLRALALRYIKERAGSAAIEYALIAAVVAIGMISTLLSFGAEGDGLWEQTGTQIINAMQGN